MVDISAVQTVVGGSETPVELVTRGSKFPIFSSSSSFLSSGDEINADGGFRLLSHLARGYRFLGHGDDRSRVEQSE